MKLKYFPLLTIIGAVLLTGVPVLLFSVLFGYQNSDGELPNVSLAMSDSVVSELSGRAEPETAQPNNPDPSDQPHAVTRIDASARLLLAANAEQLTARTVNSPEVPRQVPESSIAADNLPVSMDASATQASTVDWASESTGWEAELPEVPRLPDVKGTYYQATGHLAMVAQAQVPDLLVSDANAEQQDQSEYIVSDKNDTPVGKSRPSRSRRSKTESPEATDESSEPSPRNSRTAKADVPTDADLQSLIEEVAVRTPLESAGVGRVENVVAMTRAKGWPIALVRSDLPDDVWWVQQVVGIQGNSFAARVNFGNEYSLSGSAYRMVIVFLDTPDEVRRFRIAKQFKEIPEGTRRSREFHYIRN